jgi:ribosomal protein S18 acetylase RimI-like enzyme
MMENQILAISDDGSIQYQQLTSKYLEGACEVTKKTVFTSGTMCRFLGVPEDEDALAELTQISRTAAKDGVSVIAIDKTTDKVVAVAINKFFQKSQPFFENFRKTFKNPKSLKIIDFITSSDDHCDLFEHCKVDCLMEILFLGTLPEYRKMGIAKKLCELSVDVAQKLYDGVNVKKCVDGKDLTLEPVPKVVYAIFVSFISQRIGKELGFEIAAERSNRRLELMGQVFENPNSETATTTIEYKMLGKN